jgi:hypothetical protein
MRPGSEQSGLKEHLVALPRAAMHTTTITEGTEASPKVLAERDTGLAAAFEMLCERMGRLEEIAEHWLRREREKEWMHDGQVASRLLGLPADVKVRRGGTTPVRPPQCLWWAVNIATSDSGIPGNLDTGERQRLNRDGAMERLNVRGKPLWNDDEPVTCAEVGLDSDFHYLFDAL